MKQLKKGNNYKITIQNIDDANNSLEFELQDREDLIGIAGKVQQGTDFEKDDAARLGVAIRLLGPLMLTNRKHPLFVDFMPHFKNFMTNFKGHMKNQ